MIDNTAIKIKELSVSYGNNTILSGINYVIKQGEFIGVLGRSGTGKTTLLNAIAGFIEYKGSIEKDGSVGFCFQNNSLFHWLTVEKNISIGLNGFNKKDKREIVSNLLAKTGLSELKDKYPSELSGGQIQRVSLARAIAYKPSIILLDEPFSSLDVFTRDSIIEWFLKFIAGYNVTVIMATHYLDEALIFSDKILIIKDKKIDEEIVLDFPKPKESKVKFTSSFQTKKQYLLNTI